MQTTHVFKRLNSDTSDKDLRPDEYRDSRHLVTANDGFGKDVRREVIRGNQIVQNIPDFSADTRCIGQAEDRQNNRVLYVIASPNNGAVEGIYECKEGLVNKIVDNIGWDFNAEKSIAQTGITEQYLMFVDTDDQVYYFDTFRAKNGDFDNIEAKWLKLIKQRPNGVPNASPTSVSGIENKVVFDNYRFYVRLIYKDGSNTVISNGSSLVVANMRPSVGHTANAINVSYSLGWHQAKTLIDKIEFIYEENGSGLLFSFADSVVTTANTYSKVFTAYESVTPIDPSESLKQFDSIPVKSSSASVINSRIFLNAVRNDYNDDGNYDIGLSVEVNFNNTLISPQTKLGSFCKQIGSYSVGIAFYDEDMRISPVLKKGTINIPLYTPIDAIRIEPNIRVSLTGLAPTWAKHYQIYVTNETRYEFYFQCTANVLYYLADHDGDGDIGANEFLYNGAIYLADEPDNSRPLRFLHFQLPTNIPLLPDTDCYVRILYNDTVSNQTIEGIIEVRGDVIVTSNFGLNPQGIRDAFGTTPQVKIEVYKLSEQQDSLYFANPQINVVPENRNILNTIDLSLDTYFPFVEHEYRTMGDGESNSANVVYDIGELSYQRRRTEFVESPTPSIQPRVNASVDTSSIRKSYSSIGDGINALTFSVYRRLGLGFIPSLFGLEEVTPDFRRTLVLTAGYVLDYQKSVSNLGFPNVYFEKYRETNQPNTILYGDTYIQSANINGINSFDFVNRYELPIERGVVTALVPTEIDDASVLLAFHERNVTSLYIGEGFIRQGNDGILAKTEGVVGDDRLLIGGYGTVNPESVVTHAGRVYFWDLREGEWVRYSRAGLTPLGTTYRMRKYFRKWQQILKNLAPNEYQVVGGFHPLLNYAYLSFPTVGDIQGETILFSEDDRNEGLITVLEISPERWSKLNNDIFSFRNGQIWVHDTENHANFYGEQKIPSITFVHNEGGQVDKIYDNISINSNKAWKATLNNRRGQETDVLANEFEHRDETFYADIKRDKNTPADQLLAGEVPLLHGNPIVDQIATIKLELSADIKAYLDDVSVGFSPASGHQIKAQTQ